MTELGRVESERIGDVAVAWVVGEVDISNADEIADSLAAWITVPADRYVINLGKTEYLDSIAISVLFRLAERLRTANARLDLVVPSGTPARRLLELTGMPTIAPIAESLDVLLD